MKIFNLIFFLLIIYSCADKQTKNNPPINWKLIGHTDKPVNFCQVDSLSFGYLITYSHSFAISGGCQISKAINEDQTIKDSILFKTPKNTISYVKNKNGCIWFIQADFENNTLRTKLFRRCENESAWQDILTPIDGLRKLLSINDNLIIEGNLNGTGQVFKSTDKGKSWEKITTLNKGFKSFYLLSEETDKLLCEGSTSFNEADNKLLLLDIQRDTIKELIDLSGDKRYLKPIVKDKRLHSIIEGSKIKIYTFENEEMHLYENFKSPSGISEVKNIFIGENYYIITARQRELIGLTLSWISYNRGQDWQPFEQQMKYQLVYNTFGQLIVTDINNKILARK